jgi:hypothetical protein
MIFLPRVTTQSKKIDQDVFIKKIKFIGNFWYGMLMA